MPTGIRTVVPAIMLALFFVVLAGGASPIAAQDIQATPIMDDAPEPKVQPAQSRSIGPAATEGAFREWVFPESFFHGALTSHRVGVNANTQGIYYGATPRDIAFTFQWSSQNSAGLGYSIIHVEGIPSEVQLSLPISGGADSSLAENCHANSGQVVLQLTFTVTNLQTNHKRTRFWN